MPDSPAAGRSGPARRGRPPSGGRQAILAATLELLRDRGASRLTTREVAARAGVSEGSVFYHFTDRSGLLTAVIEDGLQALQAVHAGGPPAADLRGRLDQFAANIEAFLDQALVVMIAAQSDSELRAALAAYLTGNDLGPHRGVQALAAYLRGQQATGAVRNDIDPSAVAFYLVSSCFLRVSQRQMIGAAYGSDLPRRDQLIETLTTLLTPPAPAGRTEA
jgi:AcrR family transcriptional regulator